MSTLCKMVNQIQTCIWEYVGFTNCLLWKHWFSILYMTCKWGKVICMLNIYTSYILYNCQNTLLIICKFFIIKAMYYSVGKFLFLHLSPKGPWRSRQMLKFVYPLIGSKGIIWNVLISSISQLCIKRQLISSWDAFF